VERRGRTPKILNFRDLLDGKFELVRPEGEEARPKKWILGATKLPLISIFCWVKRRSSCSNIPWGCKMLARFNFVTRRRLPKSSQLSPFRWINGGC
jgi:hypothetical protein